MPFIMFLNDAIKHMTVAPLLDIKGVKRNSIAPWKSFAFLVVPLFDRAQMVEVGELWRLFKYQSAYPNYEFLVFERLFPFLSYSSGQQL